jgi:hypothetical protein
VPKCHVSSCRAAQLSIADETTAAIIAIHSNVERSSLWNVCNPHHLNLFHLHENHKGRFTSFTSARLLMYAAIVYS